MMIVNPHSVKLGAYYHFKGNRYHVIGVTQHSVTGEWSVAYVPQYGAHANKLSNRPLDNFFQQVSGHKDRPDYTGPKFTLVEEIPFYLPGGMVLGPMQNTETGELTMLVVVNHPNGLRNEPLPSTVEVPSGTDCRDTIDTSEFIRR